VPAHIGRAAYHLAIEDYKEAIKIGERGLEIADRSGYVVWAIHRLMPIIAEASLWADVPKARILGERMRRESTAIGQRLGLAWADACDAIAELLRGDPSRSVAQLRGATEALEAIPFMPDASRVRRQLAARSSQRATATARCASFAAPTKSSRDSAPSESSTDARATPRARRPPADAVDDAGVAGLTGRELEIVRLVAARRSNKEIGAALGISARTASTHLSNIFTKLGVESRGELADRAREAGLLNLDEGERRCG
jgi:DNA-binding CsgD family transcriptional regulator